MSGAPTASPAASPASTTAPRTLTPVTPSTATTATTALPMTPPPAASTPAPAPMWVGPVLAALVGAAVALWLAATAARRKSREEERSRQRDLFTAAFQAYADYREMPYAVRRRRDDDPAAERVRLSETLREIQSRLTYYDTWIAAEAGTVGHTYHALVVKVREVAGGAMRDAWNARPITDDSAMNIPTTVVDLSPLSDLEKEYVTAFHRHLEAFAPWWSRLGKWLARKLRWTPLPQPSGGADTGSPQTS
jgi:hypothetical protein